jgi:DNA-binding transcriptional LysR family regulator
MGRIFEQLGSPTAMNRRVASMDINIIKSVLAVYEYKSYLEAGFQTSLSVSSISKHVASAERELGFKLFSRATKKKSVNPTEEGRTIISILETIEKTHEMLEQRAALIRSERDSKLAVGYVPLIGSIGVDEIITDFSKRYKDIDLTQLQASTAQLTKQLRADIIDGMFYITEMDYREDDLVKSFCDSEDFGAILFYKAPMLRIGISKKHRLANKDKISVNDLAGETYILNFILKGQELPLYTKDMMPGGGADCCIRFMEFNRPNTVLEMVANRYGVLPVIANVTQHHEGVKYVKLKEWSHVISGVFIYRKGIKTDSMFNFKKCVTAFSKIHLHGNV